MDLDLPRVLAGLALLAVAAGMDLRSREVKDEVWIAMGALALGLVVLEILVDGLALSLLLLPAATAILYFGVFFGEEMWQESGFRIRPVRFLLYLSTPLMVVGAWYGVSGSAADAGAFYRLLTMPGMVMVAHGLYQFSLLRGGADAKALMAIALLVPGIYPRVATLPLVRPSPVAEPVLAVLMPFAFVVLVNAALLFLAVPIYTYARNAARGHVGWKAFFGYLVPIDEVPKFAWLMDRIVDGERKVALLPRAEDDREEQLRLLRDAGLKEVWINPQHPFIVGLLGGFLVAVVVGNLYFVVFAPLTG